MNNYKACAQWVVDQGIGADAQVLDYGCGAAQIVEELRSRGVDAYGCDVFFDGGDYSTSIAPALFEEGVVRRIEDNVIPFADASFDVVVSKMVMEHVEDLDSVLAEIRRVLKPGGVVLSIFPDKGVFYEGHCGIPFLHWFPKGTSLRVYYAAVWRALGFGLRKGDRSVMTWSRFFCEWIDKWTHYRSRKEIDAAYGKYFCDNQHIEEYWLGLRLGKKKSITAWLPVFIQRLIVRKLSTLVFVVRKPMANQE